MAKSERVLQGLTGGELPVAGTRTSERADAQRNRNRILAAATRLFDQRGAENVSMDAVADEAGVGKGTLYRHFVDRNGLAHAILDERARDFQERIIRGPAPLGPGAESAQRLIAFGEELLGVLATHGDIVLTAETGPPMARFRGRLYASYRAHVRTLLCELDPEIDADYFSDLLLAALSAELVNYWRGTVEIGESRIRGGFHRLVELIAAGARR